MKALQQNKPKRRLPENRKADPAEEDLITKYLPLVRSVAAKIHRRLPPGVDLESLVHSGIVGLLEAVGRFDPKRGVKFGVFARYRIHGEIIQCLRSLDWVSRSVRSWHRKIELARAKLVARLVREPSSEEIAEELEISLDTYFRLDQKVNDATLLSIEDLSTASEAAWERTQEKYSTDSSLNPLSFVEGKDLVQKLAAAVKGLPERERMVITLYSHDELTLREMGEALDLSEGYICQIFARAVERLREALGGVAVNAKCSADPRKAQGWSHRQLRSQLSKTDGTGISDGYMSLSDIAIKFEKDALLPVNDAKLNHALAKDPTDVSNLFTPVQNVTKRRMTDTVATSPANP